MGIFDDLLNAMKNGDGQSTARVATNAFQYANYFFDPAYQGLMTSAVLPWFQQMATKVPAAWFHPDVHRQCGVVIGGKSCSARAAGMCALCQKNVCLSHAYINVAASMVCSECFLKARKHIDPVDNVPPGPEERQSRAQSGGTSGPPKADVLKAYKVLSVEPEASDEEIEKAYRRLLRKYHPDRVESAKKAQYESKFKEVRWAMDLIKEVRSKS